ncbi:MAG: hypothetical protein GY708_28990 [Actinomycetia bacterium]|nr:hypothetical protein [Actinomycetes bacterium]
MTEALRTSLGQWQTNDESRLLAHELALALTGADLAKGHDVVIPQFLGHPDSSSSSLSTYSRRSV